ncbi:MAG: TrkA family potassium uptake protein [Streptosporangiales bacterium]|nr:TrkA family potassium uptake protein [Streptosporangiales bacterium]
MPLPLRRPPRPGHLIVYGETPLAFRLVEELTSRFDENVTVILPPMKRADRRRISALKDANVVEAAVCDEDALRAANIESARAIAIVNQDDVGNIHVGLRARELNPDVRLVIHFFNTSLGSKVSRLFGDCVSLSDSGVAAPSFVAGAMDDAMSVNHVRLPGRTLYATRRRRARKHSVICGLANNLSAERPDLLPDNQEDADLVLAVADGSPAWFTTLRRQLRTAPQQLRTMVNGRLRFALLLMVVLLVLGTVLFALDGNYTVWDAIYLTLLDAAGATDPDRELSKVTKATQILVTVVGISIIPLLTAAVVDSVVGSRVNPYGTRRPLPYHGHVVVVGLGNVGTRVIRRLHDLGVPVVCVEGSENALGVPVARSKKLRIPVIIGDSTSEETLRAAGVNRCRALLAVTSDDITNLETGLQARELREDLRLVLRIGDDDLADRLQNEFDVDISRSVSYLAAPAFAAAMLEREVLGTLPVGRRVLLIAEVPVRPGSPLYGHRIADVHEPGKVRSSGCAGTASRYSTGRRPLTTR